jgi:hypothetical protein
VDAAQSVAMAEAPVDSGFYVGVSGDSSAWLFWLDRTASRGRLYQSYWAISFCQVRMDSAGLQFSTERYQGWRYAFTGRQTHEGFVGRLDHFELRGTTTGTLRDSAAIVFRRIPLRLNSPVSGLYRDVHAGASDEHLYGRDLLLLDGVAELVGVLVEFEGTPSPPRLAGVSRTGDSIGISWGIDHLDSSWARVERDTLVIGPEWKMPRAKDLTSLFISEATVPARCP